MESIDNTEYKEIDYEKLDKEAINLEKIEKAYKEQMTDFFAFKKNNSQTNMNKSSTTKNAFKMKPPISDKKIKIDKIMRDLDFKCYQQIKETDKKTKSRTDLLKEMKKYEKEVE